MTTAYFRLADGDLTQNWTDTSLLGTNDSWANVPSIVGYLGDISSASNSDVDPRTLTDATLGAVDVNVNQSAPNTFSTGGVTEFQIANPTIALTGSGTADAPSIVLYLDGTGRRDIRVQANIRDIDGSTDNANQQFNVQYRVGGTGAWTNVTGGYFADVTEGGTATKVTALDVTLPSAANGAGQIEVRMLTTNAGGNDEWVGIDDINVSSVADGTPGTTGVSISDASITEGDAGTQVLTFTVTRTDATSAFTVDYGTADGAGATGATAGSDYDAINGTLTFSAGGPLTQTVSVTINGDTVVERNETFTVTLDNLVPLSGATEIIGAEATGTITNDDVSLTRIHDIQGSAFFSPVLALEGITAFNQASAAQVTVRGVITAIDSFGTGAGAQGFYISEEEGDWDRNALTSEGIFVETTALTGMTVGETVTVTANVMERQSFTNLNRTVLTTPSAIVQENDLQALPTFVIDGTPGHSIPTAAISNDNPDFRDSDGSSGTFDPQNDALDFYETIEGMRVTMTNMIVGDGFVGGSDNFVYFNAYSLDNADKNYINSRGGYTAYGDAQFYPDENTADPNDDVLYGGATSTDGAPHGDIVELDFGNVGRGGTSGFDQDLTMGDSLGDVTGIIDFDFGVTKFYVTDALDAGKVAALDETTPIQEVTEFGNDSRALTVATFNVENLSPVDTTFSTNNGVEITTAEKYAKLAQNVALNLNSPDIIVVEEVQDNNGVTTTGGTDASTTWQQLVAAVNAATGKTYQWVDEAPEQPNTVGGAPGGNIRVGFLYDTARVQLGDLAGDATIDERRQYTDRIGDGVRTAGDLIGIDDTNAGIDPSDWSGTRRSIVGEFTFHGQTVFVFGSHLPSKGGSDDPYTIDQNGAAGNPTNGDWDLRNTLAEQVHNVFEKATAAGGLLVSGGDYNEFWYNRPLEVLTGYANPDGTANVDGTKYVNLMVQELTAAERFSYDFDGRSQALDSLISDQTLAGVASYDVVHINTGYNERTGAVNPASSDHDPSLASFDFRNLDEALSGGAQDDLIDGFGGDDTLEGRLGDDVLIGGLGDDVLDGGDGTDTAMYATAASRVTVSLALTGAQQTGQGLDTLVGIENLVGSTFADRLIGNAAANTIVSGGGLDRILAGGGNDVIVLTDTVEAVNGGGGRDRVIVEQRLDGVTDDSFRSVEAMTVRDGAVVDLSGLTQTVRGVTIESVAGGGVRFTGTAAADVIAGGAGNDVLAGGLGNDYVSGGAGADTFLFRSLAEIAGDGARDRIRDFSGAEGDVIDVSQVDFDAGVDGIQHLTFIGSAAFTGAGGSDYEVQVMTSGQPGAATRVSIDLDNDAVADRVITVTADAPLTADNFVLAPPAQAFEAVAKAEATFAAPSDSAPLTDFTFTGADQGFAMHKDWMNQVVLV